MKFDSFVSDKSIERLDFRIHDVPLCIVNAVRRAIMAEVKTAAFEYDICIPDAPSTCIHVRANTSTIHNEMLAHRFSFIPIHMGEDALEKFQNDTSQLKFSVRVKNQGSAGAHVVDVTSHDIRVMDALGTELSRESRDAMFPPDKITGDHILIVCLRPSPIGDGQGEEISIDAVATCESGKVNCRWSPVSLCSFKNHVDKGLADVAYADMARKALDDATPMQTRKQFDTLEAHRCFPRDAHGEPHVFDFSIESACGLRPEFMFFKALRLLSSKITSLAQAVSLSSPTDGSESNEKPIQVTVGPLANNDDFYAMTIAGEGHTLGNLIQGLMYEQHVRDNGRELTFVGYHVAHPLDQSISMKFKVVPGVIIREFLSDALIRVASLLDVVAMEWIRPSGLDKHMIREVEAFVANITVHPDQ